MPHFEVVVTTQKVLVVQAETEEEAMDFASNKYIDFLEISSSVLESEDDIERAKRHADFVYL